MKVDFHCRAKFKWFYFVDMSCDVNCLHDIKKFNSAELSTFTHARLSHIASYVYVAWLGPKTLGKFLEAPHRRTVFKSTPSLRMKSPLKVRSVRTWQPACKIYITKPGRSIPVGIGRGWGVVGFASLVACRQLPKRSINLFKPKWITSFHIAVSAISAVH